MVVLVRQLEVAWGMRVRGLGVGKRKCASLEFLWEGFEPLVEGTGKMECSSDDYRIVRYGPGESTRSKAVVNPKPRLRTRC